MVNTKNEQLEEKVNSFGERRAKLEHSKKEWGFLTGISAYLAVVGAPIYGIALCSHYSDEVSGFGSFGLLVAPIAIAAGVTYLAKCKTERAEQKIVDLFNSKWGNYNGK